MTPAEALYEHVRRRRPEGLSSVKPWDEATPEVRREWEQMVEVVLAANEGRKPRLRPLPRLEAPRV